MSPRTRSRSKAPRRKAAGVKVRVVKGRVRLRVAGYSGVQSLSPSHLVKHISSAKLRLAAKKVLRLTKKKSGGKRRRKGRGRKKARKGKKKGRRKKKKSRKRKKVKRRRRRRATL